MKRLQCTPTIQQTHVPAANSKKICDSARSQLAGDVDDRTRNVPAGSLPHRSIRFFALRQCGGFCQHQSPFTSNSATSYSTYSANLKPLTLIYQGYFRVRYYPLDPTSITDEQTRYQIFIQVRSHVLSGKLRVDEDLFITLCGLILQCTSL